VTLRGASQRGDGWQLSQGLDLVALTAHGLQGLKAVVIPGLDVVYLRGSARAHVIAQLARVAIAG
jgi:hypothetical protein